MVKSVHCVFAMRTQIDSLLFVLCTVTPLADYRKSKTICRRAAEYTICVAIALLCSLWIIEGLGR